VGGSSATGGTTAAGGTTAVGFKRACLLSIIGMCTAYTGSSFDSSNIPSCSGGTALDACPTQDWLGRCVFNRSTIAESAAYYYKGCPTCSTASTLCATTQGEWEAAP
jgi:hypothetical protein